MTLCRRSQSLHRNSIVVLVTLAILCVCWFLLNFQATPLFNSDGVVRSSSSHSNTNHHELGLQFVTSSDFFNPCRDEFFFPSLIKSKFDLPPSDKLPPCMIRQEIFSSSSSASTDGVSLWSDIISPENLKKQFDLLLLNRLAMISLLRLFRNATADVIMNEKFPIICILSILHTRVCDEFKESFAGCINRVGGLAVIEAVLPARCIAGSFWKGLKSRKLFSSSGKTWQESDELGRKLPRGQIPTITTIWPNRQRNHKYVPKENRTCAKFIDQPVTCDSATTSRQRRTKVYPFGFSISAANIVDSVPRYKVFDFLPMYPTEHGGPRVWDRFGVADEQIWFELQSASYFGFTHRRGGNDCQRHTELLSAGVVPYFADLESLGMHTLPFLPRRVLVQVLNDIDSIEHVGKVSAVNNTIISQEKEPRHSLLSKQLFMEGIDKYGDTETRRKMIERSKEPIASSDPGEFFGWTEYRTNILNFTRAGTIKTPKFNVNQYYEIAKKFLSFTKQHLTSAAFVSSVLKIVEFEDLDPFRIESNLDDDEGRRNSQFNNRVLLIGRNIYDHVATTIHNGFNELGINVTVVDEGRDIINYFFKDPVDLASINETVRGRRRSNHSATYGGGLTWSGRGWNGPLDGGEEFISATGPRHPAAFVRSINETIDVDAVNLRQRILDKEFAIVIYCFVFPFQGFDEMVGNLNRPKKTTRTVAEPNESVHREREISWYREILPYWNEVIRAYHEDRNQDPKPTKKRILFFDHNDIVSTDYKSKSRMYHTLSEFGHVFARELNDDVCY